MSGITAEARHHQAFQGENEATLLVTSLRGLPFDIPHDTDWHALLGMARENGVLQLVHQSVLEMGAEVPAFFNAAAEESKGSAEKLASELEGLLHSFAERGIDVLPLKGPALALRLYGNAALRTCKDLDLLVHRDDYPRAEGLLLDRGFAAGAINESERQFCRDGILVELHFDITSPGIFQFDLDGIWSRSSREHFRGQPMHVMSDDDLVLFLCSHGLSHGFSRLIWILDVAQALDGLEPHGCRQLMQYAQREGLKPWLLIGCEVVRAMFPQLLPPEMDAAIAESPKEAKRALRAAARLFAEGLGGVTKTYGRSYLESGHGAIKRWRYRLSYFAPTAEDYRWAERHGIYRRFMPILRPFRLLRKYGLLRAWRITFPPV
jgi:Uncharacterised nucleotidyltransferase